VEAGTEIEFGATDFALFAETEGKAWKELSPEQISLGQDLRARLKSLVQSIADELDGSIPWATHVSLHNLSGNPSKDLWACVYPAITPNKSFTLQIVAVIVSKRGLEYCCCVGSGFGGGAGLDAAAATEDLNAQLKRFGELPGSERKHLEDGLKGFDFRKSWRDPGAQDFATLDSWLTYVQDDGPASSISLDVPAENLDGALPPRVQMMDIAEAAMPAFKYVYGNYETLVGDSSAPPGDALPALTVDAVKSAALAAEPNFELSNDVYASAVAAIESGKHLMLTGPPGTGKTTLAAALCVAALEAGRATGEHVTTTATSDWTTYETVGGLRPSAETGLEFRRGQLLDAIAEDRWLLVDELNRAPFDQAFGQLFTVLSGQIVTLPYEDPDTGDRVSIVPEPRTAPEGTSPVPVRQTWRLIATMNVFDKDLLFEMSYALMRRFAFVEVPVPPEGVYESLIATDAAGDSVSENLAKQFLGVRAVRMIGPASFRDLTRYFVTRRGAGPVTPSRLALEGFHSFLLPQFEGIDQQGVLSLHGLLVPLLDASDRQVFARYLTDVLGFPSGLFATATQSSAEQD
jgi:MoxR-like ATPase